MTEKQQAGILVTIAFLLIVSFGLGFKSGEYTPAYPDKSQELSSLQTAFNDMEKDLASTTEALNLRLEETESFARQMTLHCQTQGFQGNFLLTAATDTDPLFCDPLTASSTE